MKELKEAKQLSLDDPKRSIIHREIIRKKLFLKEFYREQYKRINCEIPLDGSKTVIELGSGGGILKDFYPQVISSDIMRIPDLDIHFSALELPFKKESVDAFIMINVFHHIPDVDQFFKNAELCLKPGGKIIMIEPAATIFSSFIYKNFHHEGFDKSADWKFVSEGPLSSSNQALPWIVFKRDRKEFENKYETLSLELFENHGPLKYILSGGLSHKQFLPDCFYSIVNLFEMILKPFNNLTGLFNTIIIRKEEN